MGGVKGQRGANIKEGVLGRWLGVDTCVWGGGGRRGTGVVLRQIKLWVRVMDWKHERCSVLKPTLLCLICET